MFLIERNPNNVLSASNTAEFTRYCEELEQEGIKTFYKGVDPRTQSSAAVGSEKPVSVNQVANYFPNLRK